MHTSPQSFDCALILLQVEKQEKTGKKVLRGRAYLRKQYKKRFVNVEETFGRRRGPNSNS